MLAIIERSDLDAAAQENRRFTLAGKAWSAGELEAGAAWVNQAVYLFRADALSRALTALDRNNAQGEEYLTDAIAWLVEQGERVRTAPVDDPRDVLGFNSPSELIEIEEHFRKRYAPVREERPLDPRIFKSPAEWARRLSSQDAALTRLMRAAYGDHPDLCEEKRRCLLRTVELFVERFGEEGPVCIVRAPGRVNLMGRHVDHRGGCVNLMAIDREHVLVARPRSDTTVLARNADPAQFGDTEFSVDDLLRKVRLEDWRDFVDSDTVLSMVRDLKGGLGQLSARPDASAATAVPGSAHSWAGLPGERRYSDGGGPEFFVGAGGGDGGSAGFGEPARCLPA